MTAEERTEATLDLPLGQGQLILVVEDDPDQSELLEMAFTDLGYRVMTAQSGLDGLVQASHHVPDLILLDVMLPGWDGWRVCDELQRAEVTRQIPVLFVTALRRQTDQIRGLVGCPNAVGYVTKPYDLPVLEAHIAAIFRRGSQMPPVIDDEQDTAVFPRSDNPVTGTPVPALPAETEEEAPS